jgi:crotonobetainyl-CoA:carnitine CoA-transferase CaiB-like acyl-CoA transferase
MENKALSNIRIIDLTDNIAGAYCTKLMAGFGAEVIKIEHPKTGDGLRDRGPFCKNEEGRETSIPFLWLNTGKKSVTLNIKSDKGMEILRQLIISADVLIESFSPGVMADLGIDYNSVSKLNPRVVMASISGFGQSGPYRNYATEEIEFQALSGIMAMTGDPEKAPLSSGPSVCYYTAGLHAYVATLMALFQRNISGEGQYVEVSIQESGLENIELTVTKKLQSDNDSTRGKHPGVPWDIYECQDGYANIICMPARHWHSASGIFTNSGLFDRKYHHIRDRIQHRNDYEEKLRACVRKHRKEELFHAGQARKLAFGYIAGLNKVVDSPQHADRNFLTEIDHPVVGRHRYCGAPFKMSRTPWQNLRAPLLGEHNRAVFGNLLGYSLPDIQDFMDQEVT